MNAAPVSWTANESTVLRVIEWGLGRLASLPPRSSRTGRDDSDCRMSGCPSGLRSAAVEPAVYAAEARSHARGACRSGQPRDLYAEAQIRNRRARCRPGATGGHRAASGCRPGMRRSRSPPPSRAPRRGRRLLRRGTRSSGTARPRCVEHCSNDPRISSRSASSDSVVRCGWLHECDPISQPRSASCPSSSQVMQRSSSSCGVPSHASIPCHLTGWCSDMNAVGANTVPRSPSRVRIGSATSNTEAKPSSKVTASVFGESGSRTASLNVVAPPPGADERRELTVERVGGHREGRVPCRADRVVTQHENVAHCGYTSAMSCS